VQTISATELARNTSKILDSIANGGEGIAVERNRTVIAQIVPPARSMTAAQALSGLENTLSPEEGAQWLKDSRNEGSAEFDQSVHDPWG
jgi:antitoxin (DNA-binding transcriptional repressor) of toxin-antitoxin stability system